MANSKFVPLYQYVRTGAFYLDAMSAIETEKTLYATVNVEIPAGLERVSACFVQALAGIDSLYSAQLAGGLTLKQEREEWQAVIDKLSDAGDSLQQPAREELDRHAARLRRGIYDLYPVEIEGRDGRLELILGKVFAGTGGGESLYAGAACVRNDAYAWTIESCDEKMYALRGELDPGNETEGFRLPEMRCVNVFSLSGALNPAHKPICVFYSGGGRESLSSLSHLTVFINLYAARFRNLTVEIAGKYLRGGSKLSGLRNEEAARLLLVWLRGHDSGHFIGADALAGAMGELDPDYMCLHELKADMVALSAMRSYFRREYESGIREMIYLATVAEMMRYIRRPGIWRNADSASAYLAFRYFLDRGAVGYDSDGGYVEIDPIEMDAAVNDYTEELIGIFARGDVSMARRAARKWGSLEARHGRAPEGCPEFLAHIIADSHLPRYIEYDFKLNSSDEA